MTGTFRRIAALFLLACLLPGPVVPVWAATTVERGPDDVDAPSDEELRSPHDDVGSLCPRSLPAALLGQGPDGRMMHVARSGFCRAAPMSIVGPRQAVLSAPGPDAGLPPLHVRPARGGAAALGP